MASSRILLVTERFAPDIGGVARSAQRIAETLAELDVHVDILAWTKTLQPGQLESSEMAGGMLHRVGLFSNWDLSLQHTFNVMEWLHGRYDYEALWGHYVFPAGFTAVMFAESNQISSTVSARGNDIDRLMFPPGDFARLHWTLDRASVVSAVSTDLARKIDVLLGRDRGVVTIPNVTDTDVFIADSAAAADHDLRIRYNDSNDLLLGFCGELRHKKGLPFLLRALHELQQDRPARLLIIGNVRPKEQRLLATFLREHPQLEDRLTITGHLDSPHDIAAHLRICDIVLCPSRWDGVPNALLEAMSCGCLVLASDAGGIPEVLTHGVNGVVLPKNQLHRLAEAILETLALPDETRNAMRRAARAYCEQLVAGKGQRNAVAAIIESL